MLALLFLMNGSFISVYTACAPFTKLILLIFIITNNPKQNTQYSKKSSPHKTVYFNDKNTHVEP